MTVKDLVSTLSIDYDIRLEEDGVFLCDTTSSNKILGAFSNREVIQVYLLNTLLSTLKRSVQNDIR